MTKKMIACLLAVVMLFTMAGALADPFAPIERNNALLKFLDETDLKAKDLAIQLQLGDQTADLVIRLDGDNLHLVTRDNAAAVEHIQMNPTGLYVDANGSAKMVRYDTAASFLQDLAKQMDEAVKQAIQSIPADQLPTEAQIKEAAEKQAVMEAMAVEQAETDAITLGSAAAAFASKFRPESLLDVKEEAGSVKISLRSDAYAEALAEAMDGMMANENLGKLVDRNAAATGGKTFAEAQKNWAEIRELTLQAVRTIKDSETIEENGHITSHFQIGDETAEAKPLACDTDAWINDELGAAEMTFTMGLKDEDPLMTYELALTPYYFWEKMNADKSETEISLSLDNNRVTSGRISIVKDGQDSLWADFGRDYLYMKGPKGGISTSVRETWSGKIRYELVAETAEGKSAAMIFDFYEADDSLICEMKTSDSDQSLIYKISRIDKVDIEDLSTSDKVVEITVDDIKATLEAMLKMVIPAADAPAAEAPAAEAAPADTAETQK